MQSLRSWIWVPLGIALSQAPAIGWSATFNVTDGASLQSALTTAQDNGEPDIINLAPGSYDASGGTFTYFADDTIPENFPLTIQGSDPSTTILDGGDSQQVMNIDTDTLTIDDANADVVIQGVTIQNGNANGIGGGGLAVFTNNADITLDDSIFISNTTSNDAGGALLIAGEAGNINASGNFFTLNESPSFNIGGALFRVWDGSIVATNNIFYKNQTAGNAGGLELSAINDVSVTASLTLVNNTIVGNTATADGGGLVILVTATSQVNNLYNNIVFGNTAGGMGQDIFIEDVATGAPINLLNSDFSDVCFESTGACDPTGLANVGNNINQDPLLVDPANGDFNLGLGSPAIDSGDSAAPNIPSTDYAGNPRIIGPAPDMGALEALPDIDVTPTSLNFGSVVVNGSSTLILTIANNGAGVLDVTSLDLGDDVNYSLDPSQGDVPCGTLTPSIAGGDSCTIGVIFEPTVGGSTSSTLTVNSNDPDEAQVTVPLSGAVGNVEISGNGACGLQAGSAGALNWMIAMLGIVPTIYLRRRK